MIQQSMKKHELLNMTTQQVFSPLKIFLMIPKKKQKRKGHDQKKVPKRTARCLKTESVESKRTNGIFVGYCEKLPEMRVTETRESLM